MIQLLEGHGCSHCEPGIPVVKIQAKAGIINLCLECTLWWFPGKEASWWEDRHTPFRDHLGDAFRKVKEAHEAQTLAYLIKAGEERDGVHKP